MVSATKIGQMNMQATKKSVSFTRPALYNGDQSSPVLRPTQYAAPTLRYHTANLDTGCLLCRLRWRFYNDLCPVSVFQQCFGVLGLAARQVLPVAE